MGADFTLREGCALFGILSDNPTDIIVKTDRDGFIVHATPAIARLGYRIRGMLFGPRLLDLVPPSHARPVAQALDHALRGGRLREWVEFPARDAHGAQRWYAIRSRALVDGSGEVYGALSILRDIADRRALEEELFAAALTDPLTGLTNRLAFASMLRHMVEQHMDGCLALFDIDYFRALNMDHGRRTGDRVLSLFAELLRTLMRQSDIISRIGSSRFAVLLPGAAPCEAEQACRRITQALEEVRAAAGRDALTFTASAGIARVGTSFDKAMDRAELALFLARTKGGARIESDEGYAARISGRRAA